MSSIEILIKYYEVFRRWKEEGKTDLKIATIFSWESNEEDNNKDKHSREKLDEFIEDYNKEYGTNFSTKDKGFDNYYKSISKRVKDKEVNVFM